VVVLADGTVDPERIQIVESAHDGLADAARNAVRQIRFVPGEVNGQPVATVVDFPITFAT
jgi:TonB family protein